MDSIVLTYKNKCPETDTLVRRANLLVVKYKKAGINKENICGLVSTLMIEVQKLKKITGREKKELVMDIIFVVIEQIDDGAEDSEFETLLKSMVPIMIDSFSVMLKVNKVCGCI
jgi:UDP-N-acetyl-D-mannosaminuronic acid transferase (WecB/TagA/CpsF family)